jgi:cytochrome oxidase Cu insertion factor (SCO1/SenC/PrrC family)
MTRNRIALILVWALSLIIVGAFAHAQTPPQRGNTPAPTIISGSDLGFRVARQQGDRVTGTLVVRINGEWVVAEPAPGAKALSLK